MRGRDEVRRCRAGMQSRAQPWEGAVTARPPLSGAVRWGSPGTSPPRYRSAAPPAVSRAAGPRWPGVPCGHAQIQRSHRNPAGTHIVTEGAEYPKSHFKMQVLLNREHYGAMKSAWRSRYYQHSRRKQLSGLCGLLRVALDLPLCSCEES